MPSSPTHVLPVVSAAAAVLADVDGGDEALPLARAGRAYPVQTSPQTVFRHVARGVNGVRLEAARGPRGMFTTRGAIGRFHARLSGAAQAPGAATPAQVRREHARALAELDAAGI